MRITPLDVRKQEFRRAVRGFDCDEVRAFLSTLADEYETVLVDNKQLRERVMAQESKIDEYKQLERTLRDTLMTAERLMQDTRERANKEGELIIQDARMQAKRILEECRVRTEELRGELTGLRKEKETYLARFKTLAETQIQFVESHRNDFDDLDKRLVGMVDEVIEGLGAKAATSAEEAVTIQEASPAPRPTYAEERTELAPQPESKSAPEPVQESYAAAPGNEVDQWRNYEPHAGGEAENTAPAPARAEEQPPTPAEEPLPTPQDEYVRPDEGEAVAESPAAQADPFGTPIPASAPAEEIVRPDVAAAALPQSVEANPWATGSEGAREESAPAAPAGVAVELATMGIPVAEKPREDETDQAVAALTEETPSAPTPMW